MCKVLITGVAGFLGSHLAKELVFKGINVIGIDNLSTGKIENISDLILCENFHFFNIDVTNEQAINAINFHDLNEIYHLASPASPKFYQAAPFETIAVNTFGTYNMLQIAKLYGAKLLFASTSEAYGDPEIHPQSEDYKGNVNTWGPRACYDEAKRLGEVYCYEFYTKYKVDVKVVRLFNTYSAGLRNDDGRVISNFVTQALLSENITVYGDGSQTRSFCYVDDSIRALQLVMEKDAATGEIINIGNPKEYTILEVAHLVKKITNSNSVITFHQLPQDDPRVRRPVIDKAINILGWETRIDLEEGLRRTIKVYQEKLDKEGQKIG